MSSAQGKPNSVLLDANIVIEAHAVGIWGSLIRSYGIVVPSIVVHREAKYFRGPSRSGGINLATAVSRSEIKEISATLEQLADLAAQFDSLFIESIDPGEHEALACMLDNSDGLQFCTADARPIQALAMLGMSAQGISFERLLGYIGLQPRLDEWFQQFFFDEQIEEGQRRRIQGDGFAINSRFRI